MNKYIVSAIVLVAGALIAGAYYYPQVAAVGAPSATGTTFTSQKIATVVMAPTAAGATTTSILNSDSFDRWIDETVVACSGVGTSRTAYTGAGLAAWFVRMATTSTSAPNSFGGNTNYVTTMTIATSSAFSFVASSSPSQYLSSSDPTVATSSMPAVNRFWPSGSYLTIDYNATNTATCTVGVSYFGS